MNLTRRDLIAAPVLACLVRPAWAASTTDLAPSQWLARWLAAFNDARASTYAEFVRAHVPTLVPYLDDDLGVREASGGFTLVRSEQTAPREITAWVRDRHWDRFSKVVLSIGHERIDDIAFLGAPPPGDVAIPRLSEREALAQLAKKLRTEAIAGRFSGSVLVAKDGAVLFREAYGAQNVEQGLAATPATRFCIGSMGKMFTAVAVLQLMQRGQLRLTDTIASLLPAYPAMSLARQVTVEHLLMHTGGTGDFFGPDYEKHSAELRTPSDFIRQFGAREALFPPGSRWGYSNFGFILLGAIVEQASGLPWDVYLERHVFRVAGMSSTSPVASVETTARPYTGASQTGLKALSFYVGLPAGGSYSTVDDLHRFGTALRELRLLDARHLEMLTTVRVPAANAHWSLGLRIGVRNGAPYFGHGGSAPGVNADFAAYSRSGYHTVVLANRGHPHAVNVADFIGARLPLG